MKLPVSKRRLKTVILLVFTTIYFLVHIRFHNIQSQSSASSSTSRQYIRVSTHFKADGHDIVEPQNESNGYISYLPHSGFNNQRQQLENALIVAYIMNRTLIVPPLYLGHANILSWKPFWNLTRQLDIVETLNYNRLFSDADPAEMSPLLLELLNPESPVALIPFSSIFDLDAVSAKFGIRMINVRDFLVRNILEFAHDVLMVRDDERYAYKLVDSIPYATDLIDNWTNNFDIEIVNTLKPLASNLVGNLEIDGAYTFLLNSAVCTDHGDVMTFVESAFYNNTSLATNHHKTYAFPAEFHDEFDHRIDECPLGKSDMKPPETVAGSSTIEDTVNARLKITVEMEKYSHLINLQGSWEIAYDSEIDNRKQGFYSTPKLIQFGSLFGKSRIECLSGENKNIVDAIKSSLILKNSILSNIADRVIERLGGDGNYLAIHLRIGDGGFVRRSYATISAAIATVKEWMSLKSHRNLKQVYFATDVADPFDSELLQRLIQVLQNELKLKVETLSSMSEDIMTLFNEFDEWRMKSLSDPSLKSKSEWTSEISHLIDYEMAALDSSGKLKSNTIMAITERNDKIIEYLEKFKKRGGMNNKELTTFSQMWIPFVDQIVCSRARSVIGTRVSTFSDYIKRMFEIQWTSQDTDDEHLFITV